MPSPFIFHWGATPDTSLPAWAQKRAMMTGQYVSPGGYKTAMPTAQGSGKSGKVTKGFMKALCRAKMIGIGCDTDGYGHNSRYTTAQMTMSAKYEGSVVGPGAEVCVVYDRNDGTIFANKNGSGFDVSKDSAAPIFLALWPLFCEDSEFATTFQDFVAFSDEDRLCSQACYLADIAYNMLKSDKIKLCSATEVKTLSVTRMGTPAVRPTSYEGIMSKFSVQGKGNGAQGKKGPREMATSQFVGSFSFRTEALTQEQEACVPKIDEKYVVDKWLLLICQHIKETTGRSRPIRNILLRGAPGAGKTEMYVGIAAGCHLPLYTFAANAMTEPFDLFGQFVPVDDEGNEIGDKVPLSKALSGLPSAEEMSMDPVLAYEEITGNKKADATPIDCMSAAFSLAQKSLNASTGQQRFKFAPGQLIRAMRDGGVWGLDEVTLPQNPGVIPALNPAMDNTQSITLPTGEVIRRHPDCIFVGTTNVDLEGTRNINQAWQDRCQLIIELPQPSDEVLIERIKAMTDYDEVKDVAIDLQRFVDAYHQLQEIARKKRLDDGVIGPRKLADWVLSTMVTGDPVLSAEITIIPGATSDASGMAELRTKIDDLF